MERDRVRNVASRSTVVVLALLLGASGLQAVDFATDVHPILASRCAQCHTGDKAPAGLALTSRASALKGGINGPVLTPGDSAHSLLYLKVAGKKGAVMPPVGGPLSAAQIETLRKWIDEGAVWPDTSPVDNNKKWEAPIAPRQPAIPEGTAVNPIDRFISRYFSQHHVTMPAVVPDAVFARRAYFDIWGLPPTEHELESFLNDRDPQKRAHLIDKLLADNERYAGQWISWWNDLLRNDTGVNYAGERKSITPWLLNALETNMPYNRMVAALVNPKGKDDPDGFLIGVNWRGTVNASQTPYMQAAQNTGQVFLGINLKCASCHDSFVNKYKLRQSYGMAALFSPDSKLELVRCDVKQGTFVGPQLLYPELGAVPENATLAERHAAAERFFTDPRNGRVPRTLVNRFWQKLFGRGLVEPVDDMDSEPWDADLLDWLASDFAAHGYDNRYLLRLLMTSETYQLPALVSEETAPKQYMFRGPFVRRLSAEEFADTVSSITGEWRVVPSGTNARMARDWELKSTPLSLALGRPIRDQVFTTRDNRATTFQALELVNGSTLETALRRGSQRLLNQLPEPPVNRFDSGVVRKGSVPFEVDIRGVKQLWLLNQDAGSYDPARTVSGWVNVELVGPKGTQRLETLPTLSKITTERITALDTQLGTAVSAPLNSRLIYSIEGLGFTKIRGRVALDDRSRPSDIIGSVRFFIFDAQPDPQRLIKITGAAPVPVPTPLSNIDSAIDRLYLNLLNRAPSSAERDLARQYFTGADGTPKLAPEPLQDFLWSMLMHPDFQYIY